MIPVDRCEADLRAEQRASGAEMTVANRRLRGGVERSDKIKRPGSGVDRVFESVQNLDNRSGSLRCSLLGYALCLRAFLSLNNFEFNVIALLEAFVSLRLDGTVVDEHIRAVIPADKAEALCVIEPFHFTFNSRHVPYSGLSLGTRCTVVPRTSFFSWVCHSFVGRDVKHRRLTFSQFSTSYTHTLALRLFCPHQAGDVNSDLCTQKAMG